jgi:ABC-type transport system involved in multi-copper enzyme maturation permease subunit
VTALLQAELRSRQRWLAGLAAGAFTFLFVLAVSFTSLGLGASKGMLETQSRPKVYDAFAGSEGADFLHARGWLAFGFTHPLFLVLTLSVAVAVGAAAIAGEVESGHAELVFSRPISRSTVLGAWIAVWAVGEAVVIAAALAGAAVGGAASSDIGFADIGGLAGAAAQYLPLAFLVAATAFLASSLARTRGRALGVATGVTFTAYLVNFVAGLFDGLGWMHHISPFGYYDAFSAADRGVAWGDALLLVAFGAVLLAAARAVLMRRDLA